MDLIPVAGPWITQREIEAVTDAATNAWYGEANTYNQRFESAFASYVDRRYALSLPSCTSALHLALLAHGIAPGDEVVLADVNWIASSAPIQYVGATPVFADIERDSWCLSATSLEACVTPRTKAVIVVDLYGNMPDWDAVLAVAERHGIAVIEDAAESVGATYGGRMAGSFGSVSTFSFHGSKTLTTGEGGMLVTDSSEIHARCRVLCDHGRDPGDRFFYNQEVAYKYKMSSLQAALGNAQLERIGEIIERKRMIFSWYREELGAETGLTLNADLPGVESSYWMITAVWRPELGLDKRKAIELLRERGIDSRPFFHPLSSIPAYQGTPQAKAAAERNQVAYSVAPYGINLPSALNLTREQVTYVCEHVRALVRGA
ncbi:MAG: DegT/DnrJ/EryC1/StrS family aminotransferase [bacterium]|nr:DegT/DnrJ/EryC1/StrS family aminotransferase [bacterium]